MAKRDIMAALNAVPEGGSPQHPFDLGSYVDFHQKAGQYNVVAVRDTVPNSTYQVGVDGFTRSILCNTANFSHIKENYYFVHVPLGLISRNAYQTLVDRKQPYTALDMGIEQFPVFHLGTVVKRLLDIAVMSQSYLEASGFLDVHGYNIADGAIRLLDMLGYGYFGDIVNAVRNAETTHVTLSTAKTIVEGLCGDKYPTANRIAAYQCTWYHFFRNDIYDNDVTAGSFNFDDVTYSTDSTYNYNILTTRQVDDFIKECLQLRYVPYKKDLFMGAMPGTQYGPVSSVPVDVDFTDLQGAFVGDTVTPTFTGTESNMVLAVGNIHSPAGSSVSVSGTAADQTDYFTQDGEQRIQPISSNQPVRVGHTGPSGVSSSGQLNVYYGNSVSLLQHGHSVSGNVSGIDDLVGDTSGTYTPQGTISAITPTGTINLSGGSVQSSLFDVLQLVEAQAIQKWRQKSMLAGNKTADQFRAHHGVVPRHLIDHLPDFIGSVDNVINVTEITSQADTASAADESNLGEIRGRGYGASDSRTFTFKSDDYGVLLLIHAIVPENTYTSYGLEIGNTMIRYTDFFQNEYQNLGLQAIPKYIIAPSANDTPSSPSGEGTDTFTSDTGVLGYAPRYFGYKTYQSKVHGMFNSSRFTTDPTGYLNVFGYADLQSFVMPRRDILSTWSQNEQGQFVVTPFQLQLTNLYVNPSIFDSIFAIDADSSEETDTFFSHVNFICKASLPMTVLGLPQF